MAVSRRVATMLMSLCCVAIGVPLAASDADPAQAPTKHCRDADTEGVGGEFEAVISGAEVLELCGFATSSEGPEGKGWSLQLVTPGGGSTVMLITEASGRPPRGTYEIVDFQGTDGAPPAGAFVGLIGLDVDALGATGFSSVSGSLTITSSSPDEVAGEFRFTAREGPESATLIEVTGSFVAGNDDA